MLNTTGDSLFLLRLVTLCANYEMKLVNESNMDSIAAEPGKKPLSPTLDNTTAPSAAAVQAKYAQQLAIAAEQV